MWFCLEICVPERWQLRWKEVFKVKTGSSSTGVHIKWGTDTGKRTEGSQASMQREDRKESSTRNQPCQTKCCPSSLQSCEKWMLSFRPQSTMFHGSRTVWLLYLEAGNSYSSREGVRDVTLLCSWEIQVLEPIQAAMDNNPFLLYPRWIAQSGQNRTFLEKNPTWPRQITLLIISTLWILAF